MSHRLGSPPGSSVDPLTRDRRASVWFAHWPAFVPHLARMAALLTPSERDRPVPVRHRLQPERWRIARALVRWSVGAALGEDPRTVPLVRRCVICGGPHGRLKARALWASLSYSEDLIAIAYAHAPIGVDVEAVRGGFDWRAVGELALSRQELDLVYRLPPSRQLEGFLARWTMREATGKAAGLGLTEVPALTAGWTNRELAAPHGYVAALAVAARDAHLSGHGCLRPARVLPDT
jgi:4'-phosphopantetheinyl transferase